MMSELNAEKLARLIEGITRSQMAIVRAIDNSGILPPGQFGTHYIGAVRTAAGGAKSKTATLEELPARLALMSYGRIPSNQKEAIDDWVVSQISREIEQADS